MTNWLPIGSIHVLQTYLVKIAEQIEEITCYQRKSSIKQQVEIIKT
jgi:hypothetical protein